MTWAAVGTAAVSIGGSYLAGKSAEKAAKTGANAQLRASELAAREARFTPYSLSTRFGSSDFQFDEEGRLKSAGYTTSPEIQAYQNRLAALAGQGLGLAEQTYPTATRLMNLGGQYIGQDPEANRQRIFNQLQAARLPSQIQEENRLAATAFGRGRTGVNISGIGQPDLYALASARETQRAQDIYNANQQAQAETLFGLNVYNQGLTLPTTGLSPFTTAFGAEATAEQVGQGALDIGAQLGGRTATAGQAAGNYLLTGGLGAAQTRMQGSLVSPTLLSQGISTFAGDYLKNQRQQEMFDNLYKLNSTLNRSVSPFGGGGWSSSYDASAGVNFTDPNVYG